MATRAFMAYLVAAGLGIAGCSGSTSTDGGSTNRPGQLNAARLVAYDNCADLLNGLRKATAAQVGPYGLPGNYPVDMARAAVPAGPDGAESKANAAPGGQPQTPAHSTTNVHEAGVDEPDVVKTDGRRIIAVARGKLYVVDAASRKITGTLALPGPRGATEQDLLLHGNRVLIVEPFPRIVPLLREDGGKPTPGRTPGSRLTLVDISAAPRIVSEMTADGVYVDARQVGSIARVVVRSTPDIDFPTPDPVDSGKPQADRIRQNQELVRKAPVEAWQPSYQVTRNGRTETVRVPCEQISHPPKYAGTSLLSVLSLNLTGDLGQADPVSVVADGKTVYATGSSLYVTDSPGISFPGRRLPGQEGGAQQLTRRTEIYKFDIRGTGRPRYVATGAVPGDLLNQYSLSEYGGNLRVATTTDPIVAVPQPAQPPDAPTSSVPTPPQRPSQSSVQVLAQRGDRLEKIGGLDGLGKGERIFAVRFIGPTGYVVTFRRVDPLYVIDLRDAQRPKAVGELKINGYSAYLHPASSGFLIGVGQDATDQGQATGTQVSLFDVRDPANPRRLSAYKVESGSSEVEFDPHAFLYWPNTGLTVLPVTQTGPTIRPTGPEALVLSVGTNEVRRMGTVSQPETTGQSIGQPGIRRSLVIGGTLWTMSDSGLQASEATNLKDQAWVKFE